MDLRQLKAVVAIAEVGSITKAAKLLHLVQLSITRQIRLLEEELGVPLFERGRNGMTPTAAGRNSAAEPVDVEIKRVIHELVTSEAWTGANIDSATIS